MRINKVMIASTGSGRGKTTFVSGMLNILKAKNVHAFKCGPDYIDPMFHRDVIGVSSTNLDSFFCDEALLRKVFISNATDINIIESAMGLYDGVGVTCGGSAYEVAEILDCPIVLLIDGHGMGYSIVAEIKGFLALDKSNLIKGVVLNRVSEKYYKKLAPVIEQECGIKVLGHVSKLKDCELKSRHLGLMTPDENEFSEKLEKISNEIIRGVDVDAIISLGECDYSYKCDIHSEKIGTVGNVSIGQNVENKYVVAVAKDEAFSFIYDENIKVLIEYGARIEYFSPIHDERLPEGTTHLVLFGGYPENYAEKLSENMSIKKDICDRYSNGMKILAECGGFMYLLDTIHVDDSEYSMLGLIRGNAYRTDGLVRFGYVNANVNGIEIKGHEFHHYDVGNIVYSENSFAENVSSQVRYPAFIHTEKMISGFPHLYYRSNEKLIEEFLTGGTEECL